MQRSGLLTFEAVTVVLLTVLLLCGCDRSESVSHSGSEEPKELAEKRADTREAADAGLQGRQLKEERLKAIAVESGSARAQQTQLLQRQAEINARIAAHQTQGSALLASLKAQQRDDETYKAQAREKLEAALMRDDALMHELQAVSGELDSVDSRLQALDRERSELQRRIENGELRMEN